MDLLAFLLVFPLIPALLLSVIPNQTLRALVTRFGVLVVAVASVYFAIQFLNAPQSFVVESHSLDLAFFGGDLLITIFLLAKCNRIKAREAWIPVLLVAQAALLAYVEFGLPKPVVENAFAVDNLSVLMVLIIGIVGGLVLLFAVTYMEDFHRHHKVMKDHRRSFFFLLFLFLSAMFGIVVTNHLGWMFFFWEITTLCSFLMIGYTGDEQATRNAYLALGLNALGGLGFVLGIYFGITGPVPTLELSKMIAGGSAVFLLPAVLIAFAGLTKSAQMPFSPWLLGAMVAPTPVSALLHSSTMVKAGVFAIVKFSPVFRGTWAGTALALVGGVTFLMASIAAVTQSNGKRILAYSTVANLGLIVACAGIGTPEALWAALLLILFHAVSKGLLFMTVGTIEHRLGSRDVEDMDGLLVTRRPLALLMLIGILGMFLAPFGMLISKWTCLQAFVDASPILAVLLAFGSAPTLFFWTQWMGKIISVPDKSKNAGEKLGFDETVSLWTLGLLTVASCLLFPVVSTTLVDPWLVAVAGAAPVLPQNDMLLMVLMLGLLFLVFFAYKFYPPKVKRVETYLSGLNLEGSGAFKGPMDLVVPVSNRNYYLSGLISEKGAAGTGAVLCILLMVWMIWTVIS